jgi:signal transduction histidine kinase
MGFGFYILLAAVLGLFAYRELRTITSRLAIVETADDLTNSMLEVRRYEKNYLLYRDAGSSRDLKRYLGELRTGIDRLAGETSSEIPPATFAAIQAALAEYERTFDELALLPRAEGDVLERLRTTARDVQAHVEELSRRERTVIESVLQTSRRSVRLLLVAIAAAILVGVAVDARLFRSIAGPIRNLEELTQKIAGGDLSGRIAIRGEDEFSSLARSFNRMQDRLHDTLTTLELTNETLRTNRAQLIEAEKFATLGRFSAGLAHEINNPLAIINEKAGLMKDYLALSPEFPERERFTGLLDAIEENVARCGNITQRVLNYARTATVSAEAVDIACLLGEVLKSFEQQLLAKHLLLTSELPEGLPTVTTGPALLRQVLADIVKNRVDAAPTGGLIRVAAAATDAGALRVSVWDNGPALPPEQLAHLFEPFSTEQEIGKDPGLGLWVSHGIMKKLGGEILVTSDRERGTEFVVAIPVAGPAAGEAPA